MSNPFTPPHTPVTSADSFGLLSIPVAPDAALSPPGDPTLGILLDYFKAFLVSDQAAALAWRIPGVDPSHPPVNSTFPYDPEEYLFRADALPGLYLWRTGGQIGWIADDYEQATDTLRMLWVFPMGKPEDRLPMSSFGLAMVRAINVGLERGRTPSWVMPGDPDDVAASQGSYLGTYLNAWALWLTAWKPTHVNVRDNQGSVTDQFPAIEISFTIQENWVVNTDDPARFAPTSAANGDDMKIENASGALMVEGHLAGTPVSD